MFFPGDPGGDPRGRSTLEDLPYESFVTRIEKQIQIEGIKITEERLALAQNGQRLFGLMHQIPSFGEQDFGCVLGFLNSYDKSCSTGVCIGATAFVCNNLSFHGTQMTFLRKHTVNLMRDLSWAITQTVASLPARFDEQCATFGRYRETGLSANRRTTSPSASTTMTLST